MSQYLEAMGIQSWQLKRGEQTSDKPFWIQTPIDATPSKHPLVLSVLKLLDIDSSKCQFSPEQPMGTQLVWQLSDKNSNDDDATNLISPSIIALENDPQLKRALWAQIIRLRSI